MSNRRIVRERVLQALYAQAVGGDSLDHIGITLLDDMKVDAEAYAFARTLTKRTVEAAAELDAMIEQHTANWDLGRLAVIDRMLLRMALCELTRFPDIPPKVSINEAIELAKIYSTEQSGRFLNGVLDAVLNELKATGKLDKSGRGLVEQSLRPPTIRRVPMPDVDPDEVDEAGS